MVVQITVYVKPNSNKREIYWDEDHIVVKVKSPPTKGKANKEILKILKECLDLKSRDVNIVKGHSSSVKIIEIQQMDLDNIISHLNSYKFK